MRCHSTMMHEKVGMLIFFVFISLFIYPIPVYDTLFKSTSDIFKQFMESEAASMSSIYQHVLECKFLF